MDTVKSVLASNFIDSVAVLFVYGKEAEQVEKYVDKRVYIVGGLNALAGTVCDEEEALNMASLALEEEEFLLIY